MVGHILLGSSLKFRPEKYRCKMTFESTYNTLHCIALHYTALHYTTLHTLDTIQYTALHCNTIHTLHYIYTIIYIYQIYIYIYLNFNELHIFSNAEHGE